MRQRPAPLPANDLVGLNFREFRTQLLSVPIIFIALVKRLGIPFAVYPNRSQGDGWCFKFQRRFVLEIDATGRADWSRVDPATRSRLQAALEQAVQLHAARQRGRPRRRHRQA